MAVTPGSMTKRYTPLLILAAVQVLLVALAPSNAPNSSGGLNGSLAAGGSGSGVGAPGTAGGNGCSTGGTGGTGGVGGVTTGGVGTSAGGTGGTGGVGGGGTAGAVGTSSGGAGGSQGGQPPGLSGGTAQNAGCVNGHQQGPTFYMPACSPTYTPDPKATMTGVTPTQVNFVYYLAQGNAQVNAILNEENLAANPQQECVAVKAFTAELNKRWQFYGRKLVSLDGPGNHSGMAEGQCNFAFFQGQCNLTPPDIPCYQAEADLIASLHPAFVIAPGAYPAFYIRLAQDHIVVAGGSAGGENVPESYFNQLAPYYYNVFPSGTQTMQQTAEFYCQKLSGKPVQFAGRGPSDVIPLTGSPPIRKVAVIYPENNGDPTQKISADLFVHLVSGGECGSANSGAQEFAYASNINTAQQQSDTIVAGIKNAHITTVVCFCDPIAPVFFTNTLDQQQYHPEFLIPGSGLLDYDVLGQLYNPNEMKYAFGPSELADAIPFAQSDAVKAWQDAGNSGEPDQTQNLNWAYFSLMGSAIQLAGPDLTPGTIRQGLSSAGFQGGTPTEAGIAYNGSFPWTAIKDFREVFYCPTTVSPINGKPGAYIPLHGGQRKKLGQIGPSTSGFFPSGPCA